MAEHHGMEALLDVLRAHPDGISEHDLFKALAERDHPLAGASTNGSNADHALFRKHFLLFHVLHRLREQGLAEQAFQLEISALCIRLHPYAGGSADLAHPDPLREYYLDLSNLEGTTAKDVDEMLGGFWVRMQGLEGRQAALQTLGLDESADFAAIRARYRQLAMTHHPDRGGETEQLQAINAAMDTLAKAHGRNR